MSHHPPSTAPYTHPLSDLRDKQPLILGIIWSFGSVALLLILLRLYVRCFVAKAAGRDDIVIFFCFCVLLVVNVLFTVAVHHGLGRHINDFTLLNASRSDEFFVIGLVWSELLLIMLKLSVLFMIERVFEVALVKSHRVTFYILLIALTILAIGQFVVIFTECTPTRAIWEPYLRHHHCFDWGNKILDITEAFTCFSAFTDVILALYPVYQIYKLQMRARTKIIVSILTGSGSIASAFAIARAATLFRFDTVADPLYNISTLVILAFIEIDFLVYAACGPSLAPLFRTSKSVKVTPHDASWPSATDDSEATAKSANSKGSGAKLGESRSDSLTFNNYGFAEDFIPPRKPNIDVEAQMEERVRPEYTVEEELLHRPFSSISRAVIRGDPLPAIGRAL